MQAEYCNQMTNVTTQNMQEQIERPFTATRIMIPGKVMRPSPSVVRCEWKVLNIAKLLTFSPTIEEIQDPTVCRIHRGCLGHLLFHEESEVFLMPCGFARGSEDMYGEMAQMNESVLLEEIGKDEVANKCYSKLATKHGILRKQNNGTRPTNSFRLVASPLIGISFGIGEVHRVVEKGWVEIPRRVLEKARFMRMDDSMKCYMSRMKVGEVIIVGRCPSQGPDSTIPLRVRMAPEGINSMGIPLQLCRLTNADFDGDEVWSLVPMTREGSEEAERRWHEIWVENPPRPVFEDVYHVAIENNIPSCVDPAILTTMTFDEMSEHPGGPMYDSMLLKPKSWNAMYNVMTSKTYWKTTIPRSEDGMFNTAMGRHGLSVPYGYMRAGMMIGTVVDMHKQKFVINSTKIPEIPELKRAPVIERTSCCLGLTKMTRAVYQMGIDRQKHGAQSERIPAICTLLGNYDNAYGILKTKSGLNVALDTIDNMRSNSALYTRLECIKDQETYCDKLSKAYQITSMIEEIDSVMLTPSERLAVSYFFLYLSENVESLMYGFSVNIYSLKHMGLDWYTSVTCSDIRWIKTMLRNAAQREDIVTYTDTRTILGTVFLGDLNLS